QLGKIIINKLRPEPFNSVDYVTSRKRGEVWENIRGELSRIRTIERSKPTFDLKKLALVLYGIEEYSRRKMILKVLESYPTFDKSNIYHVGRTELLKYVLKNYKRLAWLNW
ncbi:19368_t:CDS:2, partial [Gigaspora rosea]